MVFLFPWELWLIRSNWLLYWWLNKLVVLVTGDSCWKKVLQVECKGFLITIAHSNFLCSSSSNWTAKVLEAVPPCRYVQLHPVEVEVAVLEEVLLLLLPLHTRALEEALEVTGGSRGASVPPAATSPGEEAQVRFGFFLLPKMRLFWQMRRF